MQIMWLLSITEFLRHVEDHTKGIVLIDNFHHVIVDLAVVLREVDVHGLAGLFVEIHGPR